MTRILYVEDNADHAELVMRHLEAYQPREQVIHLHDGEQAVTWLDSVVEGTVSAPRVVLLDLRLPRLDGMAVLEHIKGSPKLREIPVIIFTTSSTARDVKEAYARYANSYLVKPDDAGALKQLLGEVSHYWLDQNRGTAA